MKRWKELIITGVLASATVFSFSPAGSVAVRFVQEFESSAKAGDRVSLVERVVYSLIRANGAA